MKIERKGKTRAGDACVIIEMSDAEANSLAELLMIDNLADDDTLKPMQRELLAIVEKINRSTK